MKIYALRYKSDDRRNFVKSNESFDFNEFIIVLRSAHYVLRLLKYIREIDRLFSWNMYFNYKMFFNYLADYF